MQQLVGEVREKASSYKRKVILRLTLKKKSVY